MSVRVFMSHSSKDKPAVEQLARGLRERGIDAWLDKWEIGPGDDIVAKINEGLASADAGIIAFSQHTSGSQWVGAEVSTLIYRRIQEGKKLIPVTVDEHAEIPALVRPLLRASVDDIDGIADVLLDRRPGPPPLGSR